MRTLDEAVRRTSDHGPRHRASGTGEVERGLQHAHRRRRARRRRRAEHRARADGTMFVLGADRFASTTPTSTA
jgi:hypothetical protein